MHARVFYFKLVKTLEAGSFVDVSSFHTPVPASCKGAKKGVSAKASSQEPRRAVHANLPSAASFIPLRKRF